MQTKDGQMNEKILKRKEKLPSSLVTGQFGRIVELEPMWMSKRPEQNTKGGMRNSLDVEWETMYVFVYVCVWLKDGGSLNAKLKKKQVVKQKTIERLRKKEDEGKQKKWSQLFRYSFCLWRP